MKTPEIIKILERLQPVLDGIEDRIIRQVMSILLNLVETLVSESEGLKNENQTLKDEINRLKGEQGKPHIKPNIKNDGDISSEGERTGAETSDSDNLNKEGFKLDKNTLEKLRERQLPVEVLEKLNSLNGKKYSDKAEFLEAIKIEIGEDSVGLYGSLLVKYARFKKRNRKPTLTKIKIDREETCRVNKTDLPDDAVFKYYENKTVQDLLIKTDNVKFIREVYYSSSLKRTYIADVPKGYEGEYGPHINSNIVSMKYVNNMSIPKIWEFFDNFGIVISSSYISGRLTKPEHMDVFHKEKSQMYQKGLELSSYQQIDDTGCRVDGQNYYTQIVCNPYVTAFFTTKRKDRLTILDVLRNFGPRNYIFNDETFSLLEKLKVSKKLTTGLHEIERNKAFNDQEMEIILSKLFPDQSKGKRSRTRIMEAAAIAYYHQEMEIPVVKLLLGDDAPQFKLITENLALCWVHDGRHYKRLRPVVPSHQTILSDFSELYWDYYRELFKYRAAPDPEQIELLSEKFDTLFSTETGYEELDKRIAKSLAKKKELLTVLHHPEIPLHNNRSERGARVQKRREDVSLQTKTKEGTKAKDTMMSIAETCKKLGLSTYNFIFDRISRRFLLPSLTSQIQVKAIGDTT